MADELDMDQAADVHWFNPAVPPLGPRGGERRKFESLRNAIRFAMEDLKPAVRKTAWITMDTGSLSLQQIKQAYHSKPSDFWR